MYFVLSRSCKSQECCELASSKTLARYTTYSPLVIQVTIVPEILGKDDNHDCINVNHDLALNKQQVQIPTHCAVTRYVASDASDYL